MLLILKRGISDASVVAICRWNFEIGRNQLKSFLRGIKSAVRKTLAGVLRGAGVYRWRHRGNVIVLTYHRVLTPEDLGHQTVQPGMYVLDTVFAKQMEFLRQQFTIVSMQRLLDLWKEKQWDSQARYCVITFDDGWLDNYRYAYPILKRLNLPATIFLPTDYVGSHNWFWPDQLSALFKIIAERFDNAGQMNRVESVLSRFLNVAVRPFVEAWSRQENVTDQIIEQCKHLPIEKIRDLIEALVKELGVPLPQDRVIVNWDEVREMSNNGISFGSHSCSHRILTTIAREDVADELARSKQVLLAQGVNFVPVFCYPNGNTDSEIQSQVRDCGYQAAVTVQMGVEGCRPGNQFAVKRVGIHNDVTNTVSLFSLRLFGPMSSST